MATSQREVGARIRGMGNHERYQLAMITLDQYRGTIIACRYHPPASLVRPDALTALKTTFYQAIACVILAQPHLHVGITGEDSRKPGFVRLGQIDLRNHIDWISVDDASRLEQLYGECLEVQLDAKFENLAAQPGWKIVVLHQTGAESIEVVYVWNHVHHDGMGGKIFHQQLLQNLKDAFPHDDTSKPVTPRLEPFNENSDNWILSLPDPTNSLPPNPEILTSWPMSPQFAIKSSWKEIKPHRLFPPGDVYAKWAPIHTTPFKTLYRNFTIPNPTVSRLITACRQHDTTITGLLHSLILTSLTFTLPSTHGFACRTPYDLRHFLPAHTPKYPHLDPKRAICNYVSVVEHEFDRKLITTLRNTPPPANSKTPSQTSKHGPESITSSSSSSNDVREHTHLPPATIATIWSVAARVRRELAARLESRTHNDLIGIMQLCRDWRAQQREEVLKTRYLSWLVTNLGVLDGGGLAGGGAAAAAAASSVMNSQGGDGGGGGGWQVRRAELILSTEVPSAALCVSVVTVKGGDMCVTCSWQECVVDKGVVGRLMGDLERWLGGIAAEVV